MAPLSPARALVASIVLVALAAASWPLVGANHPQTQTTGGATYSIEWDHDGDNEWWVEVQARAGGDDSIHIMFAQVEGTSTWHYMQFAPNTWERTQAGWSKGEPDQAFHVPAGKRVMFKASMGDGATGNVADVFSCWFTHPAGVEQCGASSSPSSTSSTSSSSSSSTSSSSTGTLTPGPFDAQFTGVRGNEWWVQAQVASNGPAIAKVDVRLDGGSFMPLKKESWGWAASYHIVQGTIVQLRATSTDGATSFSSCRQWIPASGQDAKVVACSGTSTTTTPPSALDATFTGVKGNNWWVQANVAGNQPIAGVDVRVDCATSWRPLAKQSWGGWAASFNIPSGAKVDFMARSTTGAVDASGGYVWTQATPTTGCPQGAWPHEGSKVVYDMSSDVCGGGNCQSADARLTLTYRGHSWTGTCVGKSTFHGVDGTVTVEDWANRLDIQPLAHKANTVVGAEHNVRFVTASYSGKSCSIDNGHTLTVQRQEDKQTAMQVNGDPVFVRSWLATRNVQPENHLHAYWDTTLGLVNEHASNPRMSSQGSSFLTLVDTDAPLRKMVVVTD